MFNFTIPADGSSVPVAGFAAAAKTALEQIKTLSQDEFERAESAVNAAIALVKAGHVGSENVYAYVGGDGTIGISVGVHPRPAPVVAPTPAPTPVVAPLYSPYSTGPKAEEVAREAAATGKPIEQVAKELGAATVTVTSTAKDGSVTTTVKPTGAVPAKVISPDKANLPTASERATALSTGETNKAKVARTASVTSTSAKAAKATAPKAPATNAGEPQTNEQTAKPAPGSFAKQVAKDRAGK